MKIVELLIDELEDIMGFDAVALVHSPAHEAEFHAFDSADVEDAIAFQVIKQAILDQFVDRLPGESQDEYIGRCIPKLIGEGYDQNQAAAICYETMNDEISQEFSYYDDLPSKVLDKLIEKLLEVGITKDSLLNDGYEFYDEPQKFALPSKASANPDATTSDVNGDYKILYEYKGPKDSKNRDFCRRLLDLNMMFRKEDIERMSVTGANSEEFGYYDIFTYKGSFGCRHRWTKKYVYRKKNDRLLETAGLLLADNQNFSSEKYDFALDGEQQMVVGPLMIPEKLIFRVDKDNEPYYVYFSKETIKQIAQKMMKEKLLDRVNLEHDMDSPVDSYMVESWLVEDRLKDKQQAYGFDYPAGTWMGMYKVDNPEHWEMVKQGKVKGFSIEGYFADKLIQN